MDLLYVVGAFAYVALIASVAVVLGARVVYPELALFLPDALAMGIAGLLAAMVIVLAAGDVLGALLLPATAERLRLRNMQLGAWTAKS